MKRKGEETTKKEEKKTNDDAGMDMMQVYFFKYRVRLRFPVGVFVLLSARLVGGLHNRSKDVTPMDGCG